jgi:1,4-dihydroxy-2-naphthoate octaprenyltransferase
MSRSAARGSAVSLLVHLRLHYQLLFLSPLFIWGFMLGGAALSARAVIGFVSFHIFLYGGITAYNSYYDRDEGPVGGLRSPPPVIASLLPFSLLIQVVGLALAAVVGLWFALLYAAVMILSVAYSHPRFRWKARPVGSLLVVAFGQGAVGYLGGWLCGADPPHSLLAEDPLLGLWVAMMSAVGLYPLTQIYQIDEDRARGDRTFSVVFGADASFKFALACILLAGSAIATLVLRRFGWRDALLLGAVYAGLFAVVELWRRRFRDDVEGNFVALHRLQLVLSAGTIGYMTARMAFR